MALGAGPSIITAVKAEDTGTDVGVCGGMMVQFSLNLSLSEKRNKLITLEWAVGRERGIEEGGESEKQPPQEE